ncbi:50S ribosomal protein L32 [Candidatus Gracilibacteria bacterium]|nr:50S ribosomal protein L32 [Thermales bacterium]NJL96705.1 50S ribosomal protein L32 [Candidatus Gracilibacteria bacterium]NJS40956.1 50S ribosomal protein L32 [Candidatus Gracilibacteria bacterium]
MAVPKKKLTKRRIGNRRSQRHGKLRIKQTASCSNCGVSVRPHTICANCGFYKGKKILAKLV